MKKNKRAKSTLPEAGCRLYCHCGRPAVLRDAKEVCRTRREGEKAYVCSGYPACDSFVLAHPNTLEPMGSLAGPELRRLRFEAHRQFGQLHKAGIMTKRQSYQWLDILRDENTSLLQQIKAIDAAYDAMDRADWVKRPALEKEFDQLLAALPDRAWIE